MNYLKGGLVIINMSSGKFSTVPFFFQSKCSIFFLLISLICLLLRRRWHLWDWDMSLRGDLKIGRSKRGDFLLRAKRHFKGGTKNCGWNHVPSTEVDTKQILMVYNTILLTTISPLEQSSPWACYGWASFFVTSMKTLTTPSYAMNIPHLNWYWIFPHRL